MIFRHELMLIHQYIEEIFQASFLMNVTIYSDPVIFNSKEISVFLYQNGVGLIRGKLTADFRYNDAIEVIEAIASIK